MTDLPGGGAPSIVWLRDDLRVADNPALRAAADRGAPVVVLYLHDEVSPGIRPLGAASRWWLHGSLTALGAGLGALGAELLLRRGAAEVELPRLARELGAGAVFWNRRYGPGRQVDARLMTALRDAGIVVESFAANLLAEPWTVTTRDAKPYRVFTPFWRAAQQLPIRAVVDAPRELGGLRGGAPDGERLDDWGLLPVRPDWADGLRRAWTPGEAAAHRRLEQFVAHGLADYHRRDEPAIDATSRLSPHLRFGELSPVQLWHRLRTGLTPAAQRNAPRFLSEVGWREFNWNILFHFPELATRNVRPEFDAFPWGRAEPAELVAWQQGRTGIPLVDAGMRELWTTGTMHNRVRMVVASFLVKNLLVDWRVGEQWFWDTLVDADEASNPGNWQWVAGSGADAAPYFRIFNPERQVARFDPDGRYLDRWVPDRSGADYPAPIVDLAQSRRDALTAYEHVKAARDGAGDRGGDGGGDGSSAR